MIENLDAIAPHETRKIELSNDKVDMLLFDFLQELIYIKDAERLLLRVRDIQIDRDGRKICFESDRRGRTTGCAAASSARRR